MKKYVEKAVVEIEGNNSNDTNVFNTTENHTLKHLTIAKGVTVGDHAFYNCKSLQDVVLPDDIQTIRRFAFYGCERLTEINMPTSIATIDNYAFYNCGFSEINIPSTVVLIGRYAFDKCDNLKSVVIPKELMGIGQHAFPDNTVLYVYSQSVGHTYALNSGNPFVVMDSQYSYLRYARSSEIDDAPITVKITQATEDTAHIIIPKTIDGYTVTGISENLFQNFENVETVEVLADIVDIPIGCFDNCRSLTSVSFPDTVTNIRQNAFRNCSQLSDINLDNVQIISDSAFEGCTQINDVTLSKQLLAIGASAFKNCTNLKQALFLGTAPSMQSYAFDGTSEDFTILFYYNEGNSGFTVPTWHGYKCAPCDQQVYTVTYKNLSDETIFIDYVVSGHESVFQGEIPTKPPTEMYTYEFIGWDIDTTSITSDLIARPVFDSVLRTYTVTFINWNDEIMSIQSVNAGQPQPEYEGSVLARPSNHIGDFSFKQWNSYTESILSDITVKAIYNLNSHGNIIDYGYCGDDAWWGVDYEKNLYFCGTGIINNYKSTKLPWKSFDIENVVFDEGIEVIGKYLLWNSSAKTVSIASTVTNIKNYALGSFASDGVKVTFMGGLPVFESSSSIDADAILYYQSSQEGWTTPTLQDTWKCYPDDIEYNVDFVGKDNELLCSVNVKAGDGVTYATKQYINSDDGIYEFMHWTNDTNCVTSNMTTKASYQLCEKTVSGTEWAYSQDSYILRIWGESAFADADKWKVYADEIKTVTIDCDPNQIPNDILSGFSVLKTIELPYVGITKDSNYTADSVIGHLFGYSDQETENSTCQTFAAQEPCYYNIPSTLTTVKITSAEILPFGAFSNCANITSITLPDTLRIVYNSALIGCTGLTNINIPEGVTYIDNYAIADCGILESLRLPSTLQSIGRSIMNNTTATNLEIPFLGLSKSPTRDMDGMYGWLYSDSTTSGKEWTSGGISPVGWTAHMYIMQSVQYNYIFTWNADKVFQPIDTLNIYNSSKLHSHALRYLRKANKLNLPLNIEEVGEKAFQRAVIYNSIYLPMTENIGQYAFDSADFNNHILVLSDTASIDVGAFMKIKNLSDVYFISNGNNNTEPIWSLDVGEDGIFKSSSIARIHNMPSLQEVPQNTFYGCDKLEAIELPDSVTQIGDKAFYGCTSLKKIRWSLNLKNVGSEAFKNIPDDIEIELPSEEWSFNDGMLICGDELVYYFGTSSDTAIIPDGIKIIHSNAFYGHSELTTVSVPDSVERIEDRAFYSCFGLSVCTIPKNCTYLGEWVFFGCSDSATLEINSNIPFTMRNIGANWKNSNIVIASDVSSVHYDSTSGFLYNADNTEIIYCAKYNQSTAIVVPEGVTKIGDLAFPSMTITSITLPSTLKEIGHRAFDYAKLSSAATLPRLKVLGERSFSSVTKITAGEIASIESQNSTCKAKIYGNITGVEHLAVQALGDSSSIKNCASNVSSVTLADTIDEIPDFALTGLKNIKSLTLPNSIKRIGKGGLAGLSSITSLTLPTNLEDLDDGCIGKYYLGGAATMALSSLNLSQTKLKHIGKYAFQYMTGLKNQIVFPETIETIEDFSFSHTSGLTNTSIHIPKNVKKLGSSENWSNHLFYDCATKTNKEFTVDPQNAYFTAIDGILCTKDGKRMIAFPPCKVIAEAEKTSYTDSEGNTVYNWVFDEEEGIQYSSKTNKTRYYFALPKTIEVMDELSFNMGSSITDLCIPDNMIIEELTDTHALNTKGSTLSAGLYIWHNVENLWASKHNKYYKSIDGVIFSKDGTRAVAMGLKKSGSYSIPEGTQRIERGFFAFNGTATNLTSVYIPKSVRYINESVIDILNGEKVGGDIVTALKGKITIDADNPYYEIDSSTKLIKQKS